MLKTLALQFILIPGADALFAPFAKQCGVVFMLHRFKDAPFAPAGHETAVLRRGLSYIRRKRHRILPLEDLLRLAAEGRPIPDRAVAFTIDDGYAEQAEIASPVFAEFDCPVTTFVTTGFLDAQLWFWWDQIEYVFSQTMVARLTVRLGERILEYSLDTANARASAIADFTARCKSVSNDLKLHAIKCLAHAAGVELPDKAPSRYAPMTWDQLRGCERRGMTFGPHTVTHPILSRVSAEQSRWELIESWRRLRDEASRPVPIFCYPNGGTADYSDREIATLRELGFLGAVVGSEGFVSANVMRQHRASAFMTRRFPFPDDMPHLMQWVSGAERMKYLLRGERA